MVLLEKFFMKEGAQNVSNIDKNKNLFVNKKKIAIIVVILIVVAGLTLFTKLQARQEEKIGWITDIHAGGSGKRAISDWNVVYPVKFKEFFPAVLKRMNGEGIDYIISTGDQVNARNDDYAEKLKKRIPFGIKMLWVQGNHDSDESMKKLGVEKTYYSLDTKKFTVIVLDVEDEGVELGKEQEEWLKNEIDKADLPIIIASHSSLYDFTNANFYPSYAETGKIVTGSGKVKYVISGHSHEDKEAVMNGVIFRSAHPLTMKDRMGSYYEISLDGGIKYKNMANEDISRKK